jgi:hypothetical protein
MMPRKGQKTLLLLLTCAGLAVPAYAQTSAGAVARAEAQTESRVSAEMVKGKLNPATSKPGDEIALRLNEDVKSKGEVLLKKGTTIKGVVKKVQRAETKGGAKGNAAAQSMMELEWMAPGLSGAASQQLNLALQSVVYTNPLYAHQQQDESGGAGIGAPHTAPSATRASGGLISGVGATVGGVTSSAGAVGAGVGGTASSVSGGGVAQTGAQLATTPQIVPVNAQTSSALQSNFGVSGNQLFLVGNGQATSSGGTTASMDLFSHMSNDTVITSPSRDFEVSSGAQMQLLVRSNQTSGRQ